MLLRKIKGIAAVFAICILFALVATQLPHDFLALNTSTKGIQYIIDAGHGIPDGGTVGKDGTTEQELNIAIARKIAKKLEEHMVNHILTRSDENSIFTEGETIHAKKVSDVRNRIAIANETPATPLISIHMNSYPSESVHGIQVFYSEGDTEAKKLAETLQNAFNAQIQPDNTKTVKTISKNIYLFSHINNPSVLIECGFLTNPDELQKLKSNDYQETLATIITGVLIG